MAKTIVQPLLQASQSRQTSLDEFLYLRKSIERFKERQAQKLISLNLDDRLAQKKTDALFKKEMDVVRGELAKNNFAHREIKLDSTLRSEALSKTSPTTAPTDEGDTDAMDADPLAKLDIHLRESLRVLTDVLRVNGEQRLSADSNVAEVSAGSRKG